jgi:hypothetical protein
MNTQNKKSREETDGRKSANMLVEIKGRIDQHVAAVHDACRDYLAQQEKSEASALREITIEIRVSLDEPKSPLFDAPKTSMECWDSTYICGKSPTGYTYCTKRICVITEPVIISP